MSIRIDGAILFGASIVFSIVINSLDSSRRLKVNGAETVDLLAAFPVTPLLDANPVVGNHSIKTDERPVNEAKPAVSITKFAVEIEDAVDLVTQTRSENGKPVGYFMKASSTPNALSPAAATTPLNKKPAPLSAEEKENPAVVTEQVVESKISTVSPVITAPESSFSASPSEDLDTGIDINNDAIW